MDFTTVQFSTVAERDLYMDIFLPDAQIQGPVPVIIFIHGGGWRQGRKDAFHWHADKAASEGFFACSIDYRLAPEFPFPAAVIDCQTAVRYLKEHADEYRIDSSKIAAVGSSAGAHLAAFIGATGEAQERGASAQASVQVQCAVAVHGAFDLPAMATHKSNAMCADFAGGRFEEAGEAWHEASVINHVTKTSSPVLLFHDPADEVFPYDQSLAYAEKLDKLSVDNQIIPLSGTNHGFIYQEQSEDAQNAFATALRWINSQLSH